MHKGKNKYVQAHSNASVVKYKLSSTNSQAQTLKYKLSSAKSQIQNQQTLSITEMQISCNSLKPQLH